MGELQGLLEGSMYPHFNCSWVKAFTFISFSLLRGHSWTQTGSKVSHVEAGRKKDRAPIKKGYPQFSFPTKRVGLFPTMGIASINSWQ